MYLCGVQFIVFRLPTNPLLRDNNLIIRKLSLIINLNNSVMKKQLRNLTLATAAMMMAGSAFAQTAVTPGTGTANPFAYALSSTDVQGVVTVNYSLNADAQAVTLIVKDCNSNEVVITKSLDGITKGAHTATFDLAGQKTSCYCWEIQVTGAAKSKMETFVDYQFYHPRGVDIDNNMESPAFGNIYVTEGMVTTASKYWSGTRGGNGLYIFTPDMEGVKNQVTGNYAFMGGFTATVPSYGADLARVRVAEDGRIFVTRCNQTGDYIAYVQDAETLIKTDKFNTLLSGGSLDATTYEYNSTNGEFLAGSNVGFDIKGSGDNLKLIALSANNKQWGFISCNGSRVSEYNLGNATTLPAPTNISALSNYTISPQATNVTYDNRGGVWYCQYRTTPSATQPALIYIDANGSQKVFEGAGGKIRGGGGIRFNPDFTQLAVAISKTQFEIYNISYAEDNTPTLTAVYTVTHGIGTNVYDYAWDLANNLYIVGNSGEHFKGFAIPRADNNFTTKAASRYSICYTKPIAPLYVTGTNIGGNWNPENPAEIEFDGTNYVLNVDENTTEFKISTAKGDWPTFNAGNLTPDAAITNGGTVNLSVNADGGNIVLPWAGAWTITVAGDFSTLTATTETPEPAPSYPEAVYMVGFNGMWAPAEPFEITGENGVYTAEAVEFTNTTFKLSTTKGTWDDFNATGLNVASNPIAIGEAVALTEGYSGDITIAVAGTYDVTIDLINMTLTLSGVASYPENIYAIGNVGGYSWSTSDGIALALEGDGVYKGQVSVDNSGNGYGYFQFATTLGADWDTVNSGTRFGALSADEAIVIDFVTSMTNNWGGATQSWMIAAGEYVMVVDIVNCTVTVSNIADGIESIESENVAAPAVYYNLQGVEVENPAEGNVYIKVVNGKATKVVK